METVCSSQLLVITIQANSAVLVLATIGQIRFVRITHIAPGVFGSICTQRVSVWIMKVEIMVNLSELYALLIRIEQFKSQGSVHSSHECAILNQADDGNLS